MAQIINLPDYKDDSPVCIDEGESLDITGAFVDGTGTAISESELQTFTVTLYDEETDAVINGRNDQDIFDANGGTVESGGTFELRLNSSDSVIVDTDLTKNDKEKHIARLKWTWNDGTSTRIGIEEFRLLVKKLASPS